MGPLRPIRGMCYEALPCTSEGVDAGGECSKGQALPSPDLLQQGYADQWGPDGRDDLGTISLLGSNVVRVYDAFGVESRHDHGAFLDRAQTVGLHVLAGFHTAGLCPDFNCFETWRKAATASFGLGFKVQNAWHPVVAMVVLLNEPDMLDFVGIDGNTPNCTQGPARCRVKASISALDGFLSAEKAAGITPGSVNLTIAWSSSMHSSVDGKVIDAIGYYGFQDMVAGIANPYEMCNYRPVTELAELQEAFRTRWVNSVNVASDWEYVQEEIAVIYDSLFPMSPWFLSEFHGQNDNQYHNTIVRELESIDGYAQSGAFMGVCFSQFQRPNQIKGDPKGLFGLGLKSIGDDGRTGKVCVEDAREGTPTCRSWDLKCLDPSVVPYQRSDAVATAWGGRVTGPGLCYNMDNALTV
uniref:Glycoside hydrolase family 5 domain-containing protein n=1 Tax=Noctiluca scintillans TaxID=2966 RepID=A0A7S0ZZP0_NOCSC